MTRQMRRWGLFFALGSLLGAGCGAGPMDGGGSAKEGKALVTVTWPSRAFRLIPAASNSIRVAFERNGTVLQSQLLARPTQGSQTSAVFVNLPIGSLTFSAESYPEASGSGTVQAQGNANVTIQAGVVTPVAITMASTIQRLQIGPVNVSLAPGTSTALSVAAYDAAGSLVLIEPANVHWSSSNSAIVRVDSTGSVTGISGGSATITATESESGKQAAVLVKVPSSPIVFMRNMGSSWGLFRMDTDGKNVQPITDATESATEPAISSDGTKVVFQLITAPYSIDRINFGLTGGNSQIYSINIDGTNQTQLTSGASCYHPAWAPDGTRVTFQGERDGPEEVFVMNADGSNVNRITAIVGTNNGTPDWSPDGSTIAYEYIASYDGATYLVNPDGNNPRAIPGASISEWGPAWSPDGARISYIGTKAGAWSLFVMNVDGTGRLQISGRALDLCKPCWSSDGTRVLFTSGGIIYSVRSDGSGEIQVSDGLHQDAWPTCPRR